MIACDISETKITLSGTATKPVDQGLFTGVVLPTVDPEAFLSAGLDVAGDSLDIDSFTLDLNNTVAMRVSANAATGIKSYRITDRGPTIQINPEAQLEAAVDFFTKYDAATQFGFFCQIGQTATQRIAVCAPAAMYTDMPDGDREGLVTYDPTLELAGSEDDGDDEFLIAYF